MLEALIESLPMALGVAVSPLPIAATLVLMLTPKARTNGLGVAMLILAARQWRGRPAPGDQVEMPALLAGLDQFGVGRSTATGFLLSALNPKNLILVAGGANVIDTSELAPSGQTAALVAFTLVASSTIAIPVALHLFFRRQSEQLFARWKTWLVRNNATVMAVLLLVFGAILIVSGGAVLLS
jgi:hypothetical protein